jgi:hypothetical protein
VSITFSELSSMLGRLGCCITNKMYYPKYQRKRSSNFVISSREKKTHVTSTIEHDTKELKLLVEDINCNETMKYLLSYRDIVSEVLSHMDVNTLCRASQVTNALKRKIINNSVAGMQTVARCYTKGGVVDEFSVEKVRIYILKNNYW